MLQTNPNSHLPECWLRCLVCPRRYRANLPSRLRPSLFGSDESCPPCDCLTYARLNQSRASPRQLARFGTPPLGLKPDRNCGRTVRLKVVPFPTTEELK